MESPEVDPLDQSPLRPLPASSYVSLTMEFRCNLRCEHCMIEGTMDRLQPQSLATFDELLGYNADTRSWSGLILTGSEITLRKDLADLARRARGSGFERVRIQTHGMGLAKEEYCDRLVDAGVNEFFVSVPGHDELSHDLITGVPGSFKKTLQGLENVDRHANAISLTNTVVTRRNFRILESVVRALAHLERLAQMEFWVYWPMQESDPKQLIASHREMLPHLKAAASLALSFGRQVEIKNFPQCALGELGHLLDNDQPQLYIDPAFWTEFERNGFHRCVHRDVCRSSRCLGLNTAYTERYGWEEDFLHPLDEQGRPLPRP
jgi:MoaA/NifB/PqqE/SkfB family radical SAM enzyme